jgi:hypothetical protein
MLPRQSMRGRNCTLWVNDTPDYRPADQAFGYQGREMVVQVSFISRSGRATRASFNPDTGEITTQELDHQQPVERGREDFECW